MKGAGLAAAVLAMTIAGCTTDGSVEQPPSEPTDIGAASKLTAGSERSWHDTSRELVVPPGDSFGILRLRYEAGDEDDFIGSKEYGLTIDKSALSGQTYLSLSAFRVEDDEAVWRVSASSLESDVFGVSVTADEAPLDVLFVVAISSEGGGVLRAASTMEFPPALPRETVPGEWHKEGDAGISYYRLGSAVGPGWNPTGEAVAHGVEASSPLPAMNAALPPALTLHSSHEDAGSALVLSTMSVYDFVGAGAVQYEWRAGNTHEGVSPVAGTGRPSFIASYSAREAYTGSTAMRIDITGVQALPFVSAEHVTIPLDPTELGLNVKPHFVATGVILRQQGSLMCATSAAFSEGTCAGT